MTREEFENFNKYIIGCFPTARHTKNEESKEVWWSHFKNHSTKELKTAFDRAAMVSMPYCPNLFAVKTQLENKVQQAQKIESCGTCDNGFVSVRYISGDNFKNYKNSYFATKCNCDAGQSLSKTIAFYDSKNPQYIRVK